MPLIGTISGSVGSGGALGSGTAISGTLVVANTATSFPQIPVDPADVVLYAQGSIVASNEIHASGNLRLMNSNGDEGGEIFLNRPATNTTLGGGVTVDVYQNKLRFFEQGGTARGYYLDITNGGASASTNLGAAGGSPGGSDTYVQFNDGSAFGGDAGLTYDKTTDTLTGVTGSFFSVTARTLLGSSGNPNLTLDLTGGKVTVAGDLEVDGNDILASDGQTNVTLTSNTLTTFAGDIRVGGNDIQASDGTNAITLANSTGNVTLSGDLAVNGGDITTSASTFNLVNSTATTVNIAGGATSAVNIGNASGTTTVSGILTCSSDVAVNGSNITTTSSTVNMFTGARSLTFNLGSTSDISTITVGRSGNVSTTNIGVGNNTTAGATKTINIGTNTGPSATCNVNIGSSAALGRTTLNQDVALTTGNLIGAPGSGANTLTLISSGNIIAKLDTDNNSPGHRFEVWDYLNATKFSVGESGDAELAGILLLTGSAISTLTTTTFNFLTTALTGTLNIGSAATSVNFGSALSTGSFTGDLGVAGRSTLAGIVERMTNSNGSTGTVSFNLVNQSIFYVNSPAGDITANFTSVPTANNRILTPTVILSQSATARIVSAVQVDGAAQTINWSNGVTPTGNAGKQDVFGFSLIRSGSVWKVLGQMSTYG